MTPPRLLSLDEAARMVAPGGRITARSLRTEIAKGRLAAVRIAGKYLVTELFEQRERSELARLKAKYGG